MHPNGLDQGFNACVTAVNVVGLCVEFDTCHCRGCCPSWSKFQYVSLLGLCVVFDTCHCRGCCGSKFQEMSLELIYGSKYSLFL